MSWWAYLVDPDADHHKPVRVDSHQEGGTVAVGGSGNAEINITYNYSDHIRDTTGWDDSLWTIDGMKAKETIDDLEKAVEELGTEQHDNYWNATPGNAGHALSVLLKWAKEHPNAVWKIS